MDHNPVEPSLVYCDFGCPLEPLDVLLDLGDSKGSRNDACTGGLDRGWTDWDDVLTWVLGFEDLRFCGWANSPELSVDERSLLVNGIRNLNQSTV